MDGESRRLSTRKFGSDIILSEALSEYNAGSRYVPRTEHVDDSSYDDDQDAMIQLTRVSGGNDDADVSLDELRMREHDLFASPRANVDVPRMLADDSAADPEMVDLTKPRRPSLYRKHASPQPPVEIPAGTSASRERSSSVLMDRLRGMKSETKREPAAEPANTGVHSDTNAPNKTLVNNVRSATKQPKRKPRLNLRSENGRTTSRESRTRTRRSPGQRPKRNVSARVDTGLRPGFGLDTVSVTIPRRMPGRGSARPLRASSKARTSKTSASKTGKSSARGASQRSRKKPSEQRHTTGKTATSTLAVTTAKQPTSAPRSLKPADPFVLDPPSDSSVASAGDVSIDELVAAANFNSEKYTGSHDELRAPEPSVSLAPSFSRFREMMELPDADMDDWESAEDSPGAGSDAELLLNTDIGTEAAQEEHNPFASGESTEEVIRSAETDPLGVGVVTPDPEVERNAQSQPLEFDSFDSIVPSSEKSRRYEVPIAAESKVVPVDNTKALRTDLATTLPRIACVRMRVQLMRVAAAMYKAGGSKDDRVTVKVYGSADALKGEGGRAELCALPLVRESVDVTSGALVVEFESPIVLQKLPNAHGEWKWHGDFVFDSYTACVATCEAKDRTARDIGIARLSSDSLARSAIAPPARSSDVCWLVRTSAPLRNNVSSSLGRCLMACRSAVQFSVHKWAVADGDLTASSGTSGKGFRANKLPWLLQEEPDKPLSEREVSMAVCKHRIAQHALTKRGGAVGERALRDLAARLFQAARHSGQMQRVANNELAMRQRVADELSAQTSSLAALREAHSDVLKKCEAEKEALLIQVSEEQRQSESLRSQLAEMKEAMVQQQQEAQVQNKAIEESCSAKIKGLVVSLRKRYREEKEQWMAASETKIANLQERNTQRTEEIVKLTKSIGEMNQALIEKNEQLSKKEVLIRENSSLLQQLQKDYAELEEKLEQQREAASGELEDQRALVRQHESTISDREGLIEQQKATIDNLNTTVQELRARAALKVVHQDSGDNNEPGSGLVTRPPLLELPESDSESTNTTEASAPGRQERKSPNEQRKSLVKEELFGLNSETCPELTHLIGFDKKARDWVHTAQTHPFFRLLILELRRKEKTIASLKKADGEDFRGRQIWEQRLRQLQEQLETYESCVEEQADELEAAKDSIDELKAQLANAPQATAANAKDRIVVADGDGVRSNGDGASGGSVSGAVEGVIKDRDSLLEALKVNKRIFSELSSKLQQSTESQNPGTDMLWFHLGLRSLEHVELQYWFRRLLRIAQLSDSDEVSTIAELCNVSATDCQQLPKTFARISSALGENSDNPSSSSSSDGSVLPIGASMVDALVRMLAAFNDGSMQNQVAFGVALLPFLDKCLAVVESVCAGVASPRSENDSESKDAASTYHSVFCCCSEEVRELTKGQKLVKHSETTTTSSREAPEKVQATDKMDLPEEWMMVAHVLGEHKEDVEDLKLVRGRVPGGRAVPLPIAEQDGSGTVPVCMIFVPAAQLERRVLVSRNGSQSLYLKVAQGSDIKMNSSASDAAPAAEPLLADLGFSDYIKDILMNRDEPQSEGKRNEHSPELVLCGVFPCASTPTGDSASVANTVLCDLDVQRCCLWLDGALELEGSVRFCMATWDVQAYTEYVDGLNNVDGASLDGQGPEQLQRSWDDLFSQMTVLGCADVTYAELADEKKPISAPLSKPGDDAWNAALLTHSSALELKLATPGAISLLDPRSWVDFQIEGDAKSATNKATGAAAFDDDKLFAAALTQRVSGLACAVHALSEARSSMKGVRGDVDSGGAASGPELHTHQRESRVASVDSLGSQSSTVSHKSAATGGRHWQTERRHMTREMERLRTAKKQMEIKLNAAQNQLELQEADAMVSQVHSENALMDVKLQCEGQKARIALLQGQVEQLQMNKTALENELDEMETLVDQQDNTINEEQDTRVAEKVVHKREMKSLQSRHERTQQSLRSQLNERDRRIRGLFERVRAVVFSQVGILDNEEHNENLAKAWWEYFLSGDVHDLAKARKLSEVEQLEHQHSVETKQAQQQQVPVTQLPELPSSLQAGEGSVTVVAHSRTLVAWQALNYQAFTRLQSLIARIRNAASRLDGLRNQIERNVGGLFDIMKVVEDSDEEEDEEESDDDAEQKSEGLPATAVGTAGRRGRRRRFGRPQDPVVRALSFATGLTWVGAVGAPVHALVNINDDSDSEDSDAADANESTGPVLESDPQVDALFEAVVHAQLDHTTTSSSFFRAAARSCLRSESNVTVQVTARSPLSAVQCARPEDLPVFLQYVYYENKRLLDGLEALAVELEMQCYEMEEQRDYTWGIYQDKKTQQDRMAQLWGAKQPPSQMLGQQQQQQATSMFPHQQQQRPGYPPFVPSGYGYPPNPYGYPPGNYNSYYPPIPYAGAHPPSQPPNEDKTNLAALVQDLPDNMQSVLREVLTDETLFEGGGSDVDGDTGLPRDTLLGGDQGPSSSGKKVILTKRGKAKVAKKKGKIVVKPEQGNLKKPTSSSRNGGGNSSSSPHHRVQGPPQQPQPYGGWYPPRQYAPPGYGSPTSGGFGSPMAGGGYQMYPHAQPNMKMNSSGAGSGSGGGLSDQPPKANKKLAGRFLRRLSVAATNAAKKMKP